jgi:hypothetical protein
VVIVAVVVVTVLLGVEAYRIIRVAFELQAARSAVRDAVSLGDRGGAAVTQADARAIGADLARADEGLSRAREVLDGDPLLGFLRLIPALATQINGAARMTAAAETLTSQHGAVAHLIERFVEIRGTSQGADRLARLAAFAAEERGSIDDVLNAVEEATADLSGLAHDDLVQPLAAARLDILNGLGPFTTFAADARPLLDAAPAMLGVGAPKRYLVLALDNAELRPIGGLIAAFATVTVDDGRFATPTFRDIASVDRLDQRTYVSPPSPLQDHLLGAFTWQVADAGWWPDFARNAAEARRLYAIETGDDNFDGVIGFTPDLVDALIGVTGPIAVPGTGITVRSGETYVRSLEESEITNTGVTRKRFLAALASAVLPRLEQLPFDRYPELIAALASAVAERQIQVLPDDPTSRASMIQIGAYTPFTFDDAGDRLAVMGANVAPVSKLDALLDMSHDLEITLHADRSADERLTTTYVNRFGPDLPPDLARVARSFSTGNLGTFDRRYLSPKAEVLSVRSSGLDTPITDPETLEMESGSLAVGNYLFVKPGRVQLETTYHTPDVVQGVPERWVYRLQFRKQPGRDHDQLVVRVTLPDGAAPAVWSAGATVSGSTVTFSATTARDHEFEVDFATP